MAYSQSQLVELFKEGKYPGETTVPKCIETVISHVFVFPENVYKFYKNDSDFFNANFRDLSNKEGRLAFTERDFVWNNASSPSIYLNTVPVKVTDESIAHSSLEEADELVIVMARVNTNHVLFDRLMSNEITQEDCFQIGRKLATSLVKVRETSAGEHDYYEVFESRIADSRSWIASVAEYIPLEEGKQYCDFLNEFRTARMQHFKETLSNELAWGGDIHSHNALFTNGEFYLMDTLSPKEEWLVEHWTVPAYRIATDLWALGGKQEYFEACLRGYEDGMGKTIDRALDPFYTLYSAVIAAPYHYMLQRSDDSKKEAARRFHDFIRSYYASIKEEPR